MNDKIINEIYNMAKKSYYIDEVPVGAVVVRENEIIGCGYNTRENSNEITGHAEIMALNEAILKNGDWRLSDCDLYVTLKPCLMCTGAIVDARIRNVYYLCNKTNVRFNDKDKYISLIKINNNEMENKYVELLKLFFEKKRN